MINIYKHSKKIMNKNIKIQNKIFKMKILKKLKYQKKFLIFKMKINK